MSHALTIESPLLVTTIVLVAVHIKSVNGTNVVMLVATTEAPVAVKVVNGTNVVILLATTEELVAIETGCVELVVVEVGK